MSYDTRIASDPVPILPDHEVGEFVVSLVWRPSAQSVCKANFSRFLRGYTKGRVANALNCKALVVAVPSIASLYPDLTISSKTCSVWFSDLSPVGILKMPPGMSLGADLRLRTNCDGHSARRVS
jgi:hypothetical protein